MAPVPAQSIKPLGNVLVIGGCGFLGSSIVSLILSSYTSKLSVLDLRTTRRHPDADKVAYFDGDITDISSILPVFQKVKPDVVIHTASPTAVGGGANDALYKKVNVEGTRCVIEACQKTGVKALVYTCSASIISDNAGDLINADERWPIIPPKAQTEYYSTTKAQAERLVLAANRAPEAPKLLTLSIRPASLFGPGDVQMMPAMINVYHTGKTGFQLGDNDNLFDFTYVDNVAHSHLLGARALLATAELGTRPLDHERVDGEAFFITNGSPVYFWDFARMIWRTCGSTKGTEHVWTIGKDFGLTLAAFMEWGYWIVGKTPKLTRRSVKYSCMTRYYDIGKARRLLGYAPIVGLQEGIERSVAWFEEEARKEGEKKGQ